MAVKKDAVTHAWGPALGGRVKKGNKGPKGFKGPKVMNQNHGKFRELTFFWKHPGLKAKLDKGEPFSFSFM